METTATGRARSAEELLGMAEVSFNASVISLGPPPAFVSGHAIAYQGVVATVTEIRSGQGLQPGDQIELAVPVVASSPQVVVQDGVPALDRGLYTAGAPFAAWASWAGGRWTALRVDMDLPVQRLRGQPW